jgi:antitoxin component YwqK of YwqJK toxin-antitoxin module
MKNNFLIYLLHCLMMGLSLNSTGQNRYDVDEIYIKTTTSPWVHVQDPSPRALHEYKVVKYIGPVLLKKNDEPVTGIIYDTLSNGQLKYETGMKNGIRFGKSRIWYENGISSVAIFSLNKKKRRWLYSEQIDSYDGAWKIKYYHKNGNLLSKEKTIDLVAGGPFKHVYKEWYDNGQIKSREASQVKKSKSVYTSWYENGQIKKKAKWLNNSRKNECWDEEGKKIKCD